MYKTAIIGDKESIYGFNAIGIEIFPVFSAEKAGEIIKRLSNMVYALIYVTQDVAEKTLKVIDEYADSPLPAIIPIPGIKGGSYGADNLQKMIQRATGIAQD